MILIYERFKNGVEEQPLFRLKSRGRASHYLYNH